MYDRPKIDELLTAVRKVVVGERVLEVSEHFAGYFDELGITIFVTADSSDNEIWELKNRIAPLPAQVKVPFQWIVMFKRGGEDAGSLFPDGLFTGAESSRVAVVLDPAREDLEEMAAAMPVWVVDSPSNRSVAERFWSKFPNAKYRDTGLTLFHASQLAPYDNFADVFGSIEEHHWGFHQLYVFGLNLTEQARADLKILGFQISQTLEYGFIATRVD